MGELKEVRIPSYREALSRVDELAPYVGEMYKIHQRYHHCKKSVWWATPCTHFRSMLVLYVALNS
jgi:hypothetical protein